MGLLSDEMLNSLSALTYCRALDATNLRELIDSNGRSIREDDLRQSYQFDRYAGVYEYMASVLLDKLKLDREMEIDEEEATVELITMIAKKIGLLSDEILNSLSALAYCRALDATNLRELIDSNGRLIAEDPTPGVPRVAMPEGMRPSVQDLYDRMGNMEIRQEY
nr:hypothetical protein [Tanacetum cinerariifolium]